jgi:RNA-directed DNA polymerase
MRLSPSAHQAVAQAQRYIAAGYNVVVDLDLERSFDRVNHDSLMARVAARVTDKRALKLIRAFLKSGVMENGWSARWTRGPHKAVRSRPS